jgi:predicted SprT family Zn-dependent metalloprotease
VWPAVVGIFGVLLFGILTVDSLFPYFCRDCGKRSRRVEVNNTGLNPKWVCPKCKRAHFFT